MELEFHKKRHYRYLKCYYRALYGVIRLEKKTCMLKRHSRAHRERSDLRKKLACFKMPLQGFKKLHRTQLHGARVPEFIIIYIYIYFFFFRFAITDCPKIEFQNRGISSISLGKGKNVNIFARKWHLAIFAKHFSLLTTSFFMNTFLFYIIFEWTTIDCCFNLFFNCCNFN